MTNLPPKEWVQLSPKRRVCIYPTPQVQQVVCLLSAGTLHILLACQEGRKIVDSDMRYVDTWKQCDRIMPTIDFNRYPLSPGMRISYRHALECMPFFTLTKNIKRKALTPSLWRQVFYSASLITYSAHASCPYWTKKRKTQWQILKDLVDPLMDEIAEQHELDANNGTELTFRIMHASGYWTGKMANYVEEWK